MQTNNDNEQTSEQMFEHTWQLHSSYNKYLSFVAHKTNKFSSTIRYACEQH